MMKKSVLSDSMTTEITQLAPIKIPLLPAAQTEAEYEFAKCACCGLTEECTPVYVSKIRERYHGKWICGLCAEAVKDEVFRSKRMISTEEALTRHMNFCNKFRSSSPPERPTEHLISAVKTLLLRSLDSPRGGMRSTPGSPVSVDEKVKRGSLSRSESCFSTMTTT
ncbi:hypothetical protein GIB67_025981 [Kingdonia uniflora]|uniref:DUF1677 family protein n=1 Tax=Kingdonia uniflora TaxID=39325 RepID=A0A7J7L8C6_9MAGN|nr:hypothetical protein GIB67_025981 [Kingdonia uniflora]